MNKYINRAKAYKDGRASKYGAITQKQLDTVLEWVREEISFSAMCHGLKLNPEGSKGYTFAAYALKQYAQMMWKRNIKQM